MDGPTWWNNRFWRPLTAFSGDTRVQRTSLTNNSYGPLSPWMANSRFRDRRTIRPNLRPDPFYSDSTRPLGALRVSHMRRLSYDSKSRPLSAHGVSQRAATPTQVQIRADASLTPSTVPHNALQFFPRESTNRPPSRTATTETSYGGTEEKQPQNRKSVDSVSAITTNSNIEISKLSAVTQPQKNDVQQAIFQQKNQTEPTVSKHPVPVAPQSSEPTQSRNVVSARYGRRLVRPNSGGIITKVGDLKLVDLEETLSIQPQWMINQYVGSKVQTSSSASNYTGSMFVPMFNGNLSSHPSQIISQPPRVALKSILKKSDDPSPHITNFNHSPSQLAHNNSTISSTESDKTNSGVPVNAETPASPVTDQSFGSDQSNAKVSDESMHESKSQTPSTVSSSSAHTPSTTSGSWPVNRGIKTGGVAMSNDVVQNRILLRRSMRSAPSLKREVRFDMRNNNVIEFQPSDSILN